MSKSILPLLVVLLALVFSHSAIAQKLAPAKTLEQKQAISTDDLNERLVVIGPLGIPLGEMATVEGVALINQGKGDLEQFHVTAINGRGLEKPIVMSYRIWPWADLKELKTNGRYRLRVYQDGGFGGVPEQAMKETTYVQSHSYYFFTELVIVRNAAAAVPGK